MPIQDWRTDTRVLADSFRFFEKPCCKNENTSISRCRPIDGPAFFVSAEWRLAWWNVSGMEQKLAQGVVDGGLISGVHWV